MDSSLTLWKIMRKFDAKNLCDALSEIAILQGQYECLNDGHSPTKLHNEVSLLVAACKNAGLMYAHEQVQKILNHLNGDSMHSAALASEARTAKELVISALQRKHFV